MSRRVHCGTCGSENAAAAAACWFCGDVVVEIVSTEAALVAPGGPESSDPARIARGRQEGLAVLALVSVCAAAFWISTALGITITMLVAPALIHTVRVVQREEARGRQISVVRKTGTFVRSLMLGVAARAAGIATFLVVTMIGLVAGNLLELVIGPPWLPWVGGFLGATAGALAGCWVAVRINRQRLSL